MDPLDDLCMTEESILAHIDEYTLYCHYLGFSPEINCPYTSPLRTGDDTPSFVLFIPTRIRTSKEYFWKDRGSPGVRSSGDIFMLIQQLFGYSTLHEARDRVRSDFGLGRSVEPREKVVNHTRPVVMSIDVEIVVKSRPMIVDHLRYWSDISITPVILEEYHTTAIRYYWMTRSQKAAYFPPLMSFAYHIQGKYQLYLPFAEKKYKFRNDMNEKILPGMTQLRRQRKLVITKSYKDVMCLRAFGYDAVSPRGESILIEMNHLTMLIEMYGSDNITVLFDNDGKHRANEYPFRKVFIPIESGTKDLSDFRKKYGHDATQDLLLTLIGVP